MSTFAWLLALLSPLVAQNPTDLEPTTPRQPELIAGQKPGTVRYLVTLRTRSFDLSSIESAAPLDVDDVVSDLAAKAKADQSDFAAVVAAHGSVVDHWWLVNGCRIEVSPDAVDALRKHPRVLDIRPDAYMRPSFIKTATNSRNHRADGLHSNGIRGKGVAIAIIDSGLDASMGSSNRPHRTFFVNGDTNNQTGGGIGGSRILANIAVGQQGAEDIIGHGTAVAAVAAGEVWRSSTTAGRGHAPLAGIVGYGIADLANGLASLGTMVSAWQRVAGDAKKYNIKVVNMSYEGTADPTSIEQQAMDQAVRVADLVATVSAGNRSVNQSYRHGASNVLAVGAVHADTRVVASFSNRGPVARQTYPNLVANGVSMIMPEYDNESTDRIASGSSYAAPQVAGAAALYRSVNTNASALETRAAILASTEDVSGKNRRAPYNSVNAYGAGYLRDDQLVAIAQGKLGSKVFQGSLSGTQLFQQYSFPVVQGRWYSAVLVWDRQDTTTINWSNLDLTGSYGGSTSEHDTFEKIVFQATKTGNETFFVIARSLDVATQSFVLVAAEALTPFVRGRVSGFGTGCADHTSLVPDLFGAGEPEIGVGYDVGLDRVQPSSATIVTVGLSNTAWGALTLPFSLAPLGAPGCSLLASGDVLLGGVSNAVGRLSLRVGIPDNKSLIGRRIYHQALVLSPRANTFGWITSNGISVAIGGDSQ